MSQTPTDAATRLGALVRIPTVCARGVAVDHAAFEAFAAAIADLYPRTHATLERERVAEHALLYRWAANEHVDPHPVVLLAHQDVVPAPLDGWDGDPFSGVVRDGFVHGRGTLDDKGSLVAVLEAVETLLAEGFTPARDVWLSFGADEEVSGVSAPAAVARLRERGVVDPFLVLDEGGAVVTGAFPGVTRPLAVVGVAEKGICDIELATYDAGGHASTPARGGATARLARAITRLEAHPFPARLPAPVLAMLESLASHARGPVGMALRPALGAARRAPRTAGRVLARALAAVGAEVNAMVRTTVAVTTLEGSAGANVVASRARANLNVRVAPGETVDGVLARLRRVVADPHATITLISGEDPSPVSPAGGPAWELVGAAVAAAYPEAVPTPYVMLGASDARFFHTAFSRVYRFSPFTMTRAQRESVHGANECLTVDALQRGIDCYRALLRGVPPSEDVGGAA